MSPINCLVVYLRIPAGVKKDNHICLNKGEASSPALYRRYEHIDMVPMVRIENLLLLVHAHSAIKYAARVPFDPTELLYQIQCLQ